MAAHSGSTTSLPEFIAARDESKKSDERFRIVHDRVPTALFGSKKNDLESFASS
jgi:hypothetical protein